MLTGTCGLCLAGGAAVIFLAKSWVTMVVGQLLFSAGSVFLVPARSLLAGLVEQKHAGALFTLSAVSMLLPISIIPFLGFLDRTLLSWGGAGTSGEIFKESDH